MKIQGASSLLRVQDVPSVTGKVGLSPWEAPNFGLKKPWLIMAWINVEIIMASQWNGHKLMKIGGLDTTPFKSKSKASPLLSSFYLASTQRKNMWTCAFCLRWDDCPGWPDTHILLWRSIPDIMCKNCMVGFPARQRAQGDRPGPGQWTDPQCCRVSRKKGDRWRRGRGDNDRGDGEGWCWWWLGCEWKKGKRQLHIVHGCEIHPIIYSWLVVWNIFYFSTYWE